MRQLQQFDILTNDFCPKDCPYIELHMVRMGLGENGVLKNVHTCKYRRMCEYISRVAVAFEYDRSASMLVKEDQCIS